MTETPIPKDEDARVTALHGYNILDTPPEEEFDQIVRLASAICKTPISMVSLVDRRRQWFKSRVGMPVSETPRDVAFCSYTILRPGLFVVEDALADERFVKNPLVTAEPHIRFYAGAPLISADGHSVGTLCVIDRVPRELDSEQRDCLLSLAYLTMRILDLRRKVAELRRA